MRIFAVVLAGLIVLMAGYVINARAIEHRSIQSRLIEDYFWITNEKAVFSDPEVLTAELAAQTELDGQLPTVPHDMDSVALIEMNGMQVYEFGG